MIAGKHSAGAECIPEERGMYSVSSCAEWMIPQNADKAFRKPFRRAPEPRNTRNGFGVRTAAR